MNGRIASIMRAAAAASILATACATGPPLQETAVELQDVPFHPQAAYERGPAALATVLSYSGASVTPEAIINEVYIPGLRGSLQIELLAAARRHGRIPFLVPPDGAALLAEVSAGNPVLVLQNKGFEVFPKWHYAVVVGYDPDRNRFLLRSGGKPRKTEHSFLFLRSWRLADYWGFVTMEPGTFPATATPDSWARALAASEEFLDVPSAETAYRTAVKRWPDNGLILFAAGNYYYRSGRFDEAYRTYRRLLESEPDHAAGHNNLGNLLLDNGCHEAGEAQIRLAMNALAEDDPLAPSVRDSLARLGPAARSEPESSESCRLN